MAPPVAAILCLCFVAYLFRREFRLYKDDRISWAPFVWMFLAGSRYASTWLNLRAPSMSIGGYAEGSPFDRAVFLALIAWGVLVLARRYIDWPRMFRQNAVLALYLLFCLSSVLWTDEPVILLKRWIKDLGNPIMALVLLTERRPYAALGATIRRFAYICIPVSALFVRYYPDMGRAYKASGEPMYTGIGQQKNSLGTICLVVGLYFAWRWICCQREKAAWRSSYPEFALAIMMVWLLNMSDSQTSTVCLGIGIGILLMSRMPWIECSPSRIVPIIVVSAVAILAFDYLLDIRTHFFELIGRDSSLTNRDTLWEVVLSQRVSDWLGAGFMSFWSGERMLAIWQEIGKGVNQAHNGYIEQYLNLGYVGVAFILLIVCAAIRNIQARFVDDATTALFRLVIVICVLVSNYTESSFYGINVLWTLFLVAAINPVGLTVGGARGVRARRATPTGSQRPSEPVTALRAAPCLLPAGQAVTAASLSRHRHTDWISNKS